MCTTLETRAFVAKQDVHQEEIKLRLLCRLGSCGEVKKHIIQRLARAPGETWGGFQVECVSRVQAVYLDFIVCHDKSPTSGLIKGVFCYELCAVIWP